MPRALSIETSGRIGSVALSDNGQILSEETFSHGLQHAANLLPMIDRLTKQHRWTPADIQHVYVSIGPGSFTGLRVGVTLAKTLAFATGAKIVAVPTARVLAANAPPEATTVVIVLDAKRGQIFTAHYTKTPKPHPGGATSVTLSPPAPTTADQQGPSDANAQPNPLDLWHEVAPARLDTLAHMLTLAARPVHLIGEGIPYHRDAIPADDAGVIFTAEPHWQARAAAVAALGHAMAARGDFADAYALTPLYVRLPEPEEKRLAAEAAAASARS